MLCKKVKLIGVSLMDGTKILCVLSCEVGKQETPTLDILFNEKRVERYALEYAYDSSESIEKKEAENIFYFEKDGKRVVILFMNEYPFKLFYFGDLHELKAKIFNPWVEKN